MDKDELLNKLDDIEKTMDTLINDPRMYQLSIIKKSLEEALDKIIDNESRDSRMNILIILLIILILTHTSGLVSLWLIK